MTQKCCNGTDNIVHSDNSLYIHIYIPNLLTRGIYIFLAALKKKKKKKSIYIYGNTTIIAGCEWVPKVRSSLSSAHRPDVCNWQQRGDLQG